MIATTVLGPMPTTERSVAESAVFSSTGCSIGRAFRSGKIKRMEVYKGDEAVKRYGEKGRNGVVEIRARR